MTRKKCFTCDDISELNLPTSREVEKMDVKIEWVVEGVIPKYANTMIYSEGGVGKSHLMLQIATAVANGQDIFGLKVSRMPVTYIDFENPVSIVVDRVKKIGGSRNLRIWHIDNNPPPYLLDADEMWQIYTAFDSGLFIFDSLRSSHHLDENASKDISLLMERLKFIRGAESTLVLIHNENKTGGFRGSSALADLCDQVLMYGCVNEVGEDFEVSVAKTHSRLRRLTVGGKHRFDTPIIKTPLYLTLNEGGLLEKVTYAAPEDKDDLLVAMLTEGKTQTEIGDVFDISQQAVSKWIERLKKGGKL